MEKLAHAWAALCVAWHYFCVYVAPVLAASLLPTVLAGLSDRPSTKDGKLVQLLKLAVRACGWAVHYNEPGSVKLPLSELLVLLWKGFVAVYRVFKPAPALLALALGLLVSGCATSATPKGATLAQKVQADSAAVQQIVLDVESKCGAQFVSLAPVLADLLAVIKDPTNVLGDVLAAIDAYAPLQSDAAASMCVLKTVVADIKALQPAKAAQLDRLVAQVEAGQSKAPDGGVGLRTTGAISFDEARRNGSVIMRVRYEPMQLEVYGLPVL